MRWLFCLLVLLAACAAPQVDTDAEFNEITGSIGVDVEPERTDLIVEPVEEPPVLIDDFGEEFEEFVNIPEDYTIGEAHALTPELELLVMASPCYQYTWEGIEQYQSRYNLDVKKSIRFSYVGARLFKGWILNVLTTNSRVQVDTKTVMVLVNDGEVTCVDEGNFAIDWQNALGAN